MVKKLLTSLLGLTALGGCADDWDCKTLDPIPYGAMTTELQVCDWGNDDWDQDNEDILFLKLKNAAEEVVCEGELNPTDTPFEFKVNDFYCDVNNDGAKDFAVNVGTTLKYAGGICFVEEEDGREVKTFCDVDNDAVIDWIVLTSYDGNKKIEEHDSDFNGIPETVKEYINGELVKESLDYDQNGVFKEVKEYENGQLVRETKDNNQDGNLDWIVEYNSEGLVTKRVFTDNEGKTLTTKYWYDDQDRETLRRIDNETDGLIDAEVATIYGDVKVETHTLFEDGVAVLVRREEEYPDFERRYIDGDVNGKFERMLEYVPVPKGDGILYKKVTDARDPGEDGQYDKIQRFDLNNNIVQESNWQGDHYHEVYWAHDDKGNMVMSKTDWNGDGQIDFETIYGWMFLGGEHVKVSSKTTLFESNGGIEKIYYKSIFGNKTDTNCPKKLHLMDADVDLLGDGTIDFIQYSVCNDEGKSIGTEKIEL